MDGLGAFLAEALDAGLQVRDAESSQDRNDRVPYCREDLRARARPDPRVPEHAVERRVARHLAPVEPEPGQGVPALLLFELPGPARNAGRALAAGEHSGESRRQDRSRLEPDPFGLRWSGTVSGYSHSVRRSRLAVSLPSLNLWRSGRSTVRFPPTAEGP